MHTAPSPANNLARATSTLPLDPARTTTPQPVCSAGFRMEPWRSLGRLASWTFTAIPLHPIFLQLKVENMKKSGASQGQSASELISKRIAELGDWRRDTLSRMRMLIKEAD